MEYKLEEFITYEQPAKYIVESDQYNDSYDIPVLTAGQTFILGYTNEQDNIFDNLPVIIFDDFTTSVQYVDFPFKVKSSAMKLLKNTSKSNLKYCYYMLKYFQKQPENHKRQWISSTSQIKIDLPNIDNQSKIVEKLDFVQEIIAKYKRQLNMLDELVKARFVELFGNPIINDKGLITELLANVSNLKAGKAIKTGELSENNDTNSLFPCFGGNGIRGYINRYTHDGTFPIIGRQGALSGNVNFAKGKFYATEHAIVVTPKVELDDTWFFYCLKYLDLKRFQTGAAQPGVSVEKLNNISIPLPNYKSQLYFSDFVKEVDKSRLEVQKSLKKTQELFDSLMQKYFG